MNTGNYNGDMSKDGHGDNKPTSKGRQSTGENANYTPEDIDTVLDQLLNEPEAKPRPSRWDILLERRDKIQALFDAKKSISQIVKALNSTGFDISERTFKTYWYDIKAGATKPGKGNKKKPVISASVSEPESAVKNEPVFEEKPASVSVAGSENSEGENQAGNDLKNVQDQDEEKIQQRVGKCWCGAETMEFAQEGKLYEKCCLYDSGPDKENHLSPVRVG